MVQVRKIDDQFIINLEENDDDEDDWYFSDYFAK